MNTNYVIFDLETTGLDPRVDRVCEIGAIKVCQGKRLNVFSTLINPQRPISQEAFAVNQITSEMVKNAPTIDQVMLKVIQFIQGSILVSYNAYFDLGFLNAELKRLGFPQWTHPAIDVLTMARQLIPNLDGYSLGKVARKLGIPYPTQHRALADAEVTLQIFGRLISANKEGLK